MSGSDLGTIAQAFITYFSGANGGYICIAAAIIVWIICACNVRRNGRMDMIGSPNKQQTSKTMSRAGMDESIRRVSM